MLLSTSVGYSLSPSPRRGCSCLAELFWPDDPGAAGKYHSCCVVLFYESQLFFIHFWPGGMQGFFQAGKKKEERKK